MQVKTKTAPPADITVTAGKNVSLTVIIGMAQIGGSQVKFTDGPVLAKGKVENLTLGKGSTLIGRTLEVITNVLDANAATNKINITHDFTNATPASFQDSDTVDNEGDIFSLTATYVFK